MHVALSLSLRLFKRLLVKLRLIYTFCCDVASTPLGQIYLQSLCRVRGVDGGVLVGAFRSILHLLLLLFRVTCIAGLRLVDSHLAFALTDLVKV